MSDYDYDDGGSAGGLDPFDEGFGDSLEQRFQQLEDNITGMLSPAAGGDSYGDYGQSDGGYGPDAEAVAEGEQAARDLVSGWAGELGPINADDVLAAAREAFPHVAAQFDLSEPGAAEELAQATVRAIAEDAASARDGNRVASNLMAVESRLVGEFDRNAAMNMAAQILPEIADRYADPSEAAMTAVSIAARAVASNGEAPAIPSPTALARYYAGKASVLKDQGPQPAIMASDASAHSITAKYAAQAAQIKRWS